MKNWSNGIQQLVYFLGYKLSPPERDLATWKSIRLAIHTNMAACYLQKKEYSKTKDACRLVWRMMH
jgi:hypothetical protein